ncbi:hypothetical protein [Nitrosospira briensis]|uniref:hypothetical protein n=1 Tax=Nitrosospira briensis TaxID=35799 RepID=UPI0008DF209F|nr:hypothetical protein [Nitrosospira briensis]SFO11748.1 hypothetical protein SAMN05216332_105129 [Nitrosospira briensis]
MEGTRLLTGISRLLPGRTITGFITFGLVARGRSVAGNVTDALVTALPGRSLIGYPRQSETSPSAKKALNGRIARMPLYREMWNQLARVDPVFRNSIFDRWLRERGRMVPVEDRQRYQIEHWQRVLPPERLAVPATNATNDFEYYVQRYLDGGM